MNRKNVLITLILLVAVLLSGCNPTLKVGDL